MASRLVYHRIARRGVGAFHTWLFALLAMACVRAPIAIAQSTTDATASNLNQEAMPGLLKLGVSVNRPNAFQGYTLIFPFNSTNTYLVDMQGRIVNQWESKYTPGEVAFLEENGHLLRAAKLRDSEAIFAGMGPGGRVQEFTWEGQVIWDFKFHNDTQIQHHAVTRMPNGNVLMIVWERKSPEEQAAAGVKPDISSKYDMLVDSLVEVTPAGVTGGEIVWEWHLWDHMIQDHDASKEHFGDVAEHPELIDVNCARTGMAFVNLSRATPAPTPSGNQATREQGGRKAAAKSDVEKLKGIGYVGAGTGGNSKKFLGLIADWTHVNAAAYNPELDQIILSSREFSEIWVIDHSTTTAEAAGHRGGRSGKGGDILFRWGNPANYRAGTEADRKLFHQHDAHWIPPGLPGAGNVLLFNNGPRPDGEYSTVDEIALPNDARGRYDKPSGAPFGPAEPLWSYSAPTKAEFFGRFMSGAQRLPNGNTLASTGFTGTIVEVTPNKEVVWRYAVPPDVRTEGVTDAKQSVELVPQFLVNTSIDKTRRDMLSALNAELSEMLDKVLDDEQRQQLGRFRSHPQAPQEFGHVMAAPVQDWLQLSAEQRNRVDQIQTDAAAKLEAILTFQERAHAFGQLQIVKAFASPGTSAIFRAYRYGTDYPGLAGRDLAPGRTIGE